MINVTDEMNCLEYSSDIVMRHGNEFTDYEYCVYDAIGSMLRDYQNEMYENLYDLLMYYCMHALKVRDYEDIDENQFEAIQQLCQNWNINDTLNQLFSRVLEIVEGKND